MGLTINNGNFQQYKLVYKILIDNFLFKKVTEQNLIGHPSTIIDRLENENFKLAKLCLIEGLRDIFSMIKNNPEVDFDLAKTNSQLLENNLPNLNSLIGIIRDTHKEVLKNKKIKNLDEYYIIKELVIDLSTNLTSEERTSLDQYLVEFEISYKEKLQ